MSRITLDDFNGAVDARFEDVEFDVTGDKVARFVQPLRMTQERRDKISGVADTFVTQKYESEEELAGLLLKFLKIAAKTKADYAAMRDHLGGDLARTLVACELLLEAYGGLSGMGEA